MSWMHDTCWRSLNVGLMIGSHVCDVWLYFYVAFFVFVTFFFFFFKQKTAYEMTCDWSSDVCSSDLLGSRPMGPRAPRGGSGRGQLAGERGTARGGEALVARDIGAKLFCAACRRYHQAAARGYGQGLPALARPHTEPLQLGRRGARRRGAGASAAEERTGPVDRRRHRARAARARHRAAARRSARELRAGAERPEDRHAAGAACAPLRAA